MLATFRLFVITCKPRCRFSARATSSVVVPRLHEERRLVGNVLSDQRAYAAFFVVEHHALARGVRDVLRAGRKARAAVIAAQQVHIRRAS